MRKALLVAACLLLPFSAFGEEAESASLMVFFRCIGPSIDRENGYLLYESLLSKLSVFSEDLRIVESPYGPILGASDPKPPDLLELSAIASGEGAAAWLAVQASGSMASVDIEYLLTDTRRNVRLAEGEIAERDATRGVERRFWNELTAAVGAVDQGADGAGRKPGRGGWSYVLITGLPETRITGIPGEARFVIGKEGWLRIRLEQPATYRINAFLGGYKPVARSFYLGEDVAEIDLDQRPGSLWAVSFGLGNATYPGLGVSYYLFRSVFFVRMAFNTLTIFNPLIENRTFPLSFIDFSIGGYLSRPDRLLRFYIALGFFNRVNHDAAFSLDQLSSLGLSYTLGFDLPAGSRFSYFMEFHPRLHIVNDPQRILDARSGAQDESDYLLWDDNFPLAGRWVMDFGNIYLGFRWNSDSL